MVELLHGGDVHALVGAMGVLNGRSEGNHLHTRVVASDDAALQACVDSDDAGLGVELLLLDLLHHLQDMPVEIGFPSRV